MTPAPAANPAPAAIPALRAPRRLNRLPTERGPPSAWWFSSENWFMVLLLFGSNPFDQRIVAHLLAKYVSPESKQRNESITAKLGRHEWLVKDLAEKVPVSTTNLYRWLKLGWINYRHLAGPPRMVVCWADADEIKRLRKLRYARRGWWEPPVSKELTTPKPRPAAET